MEGGASLYGCLLGIAIGDSLGLPFEGLSDQRVARRLGSKSLTQSLVLGRGMLSDDTEQACLVIEAVRLSSGDVRRFQTIFARRLRSWFLALPAGVGLATVKSCMRLLAGVSPQKAGVNSAGNGAAMRSPVLGALFPTDSQARRDFCDACSVVTHSDPRAVDGARVMVESVALGAQVVNGTISRTEFLDCLAEQCDSMEWKEVLQRMRAPISPGDFAKSIGSRGKVSGYVLHSVPVALQIWLSDLQNPRGGLETAIRLGGDTDTVGAMVGALYGASLGPGAFPSEWHDRIVDFPRSKTFLKRLAQADSKSTPNAHWPLCLIRNLIFLAIVLLHGLRRLLP